MWKANNASTSTLNDIGQNLNSIARPIIDWLILNHLRRLKLMSFNNYFYISAY